MAALGLTGCYWLQLTALCDRTSCLLCSGLKASLMAVLASGRGLRPSSLRRDRKLQHDPRKSTWRHQNTRITDQQGKLLISKIWDRKMRWGFFFVQRQTDESVWCRHRGDSGGQMMKGKAEEFIKGVSRPKVNMQR